MQCGRDECEAERRERSRFCSDRCYQLDYARRNAEKRRQTSVQWRKDNAERKRAANRKWFRENPATMAAITARRRNAAGPGVTNEQWRLILSMTDNRCSYCGRDGKMTMDHVVPLSRGGLHAVENVTPACHSCNSRKNAKDVRDWMPGWVPPPWITLPER